MRHKIKQGHKGETDNTGALTYRYLLSEVLVREIALQLQHLIYIKRPANACRFLFPSSPMALPFEMFIRYFPLHTDEEGRTFSLISF